MFSRRRLFQLLAASPFAALTPQAPKSSGTAMELRHQPNDISFSPAPNATITVTATSSGYLRTSTWTWTFDEPSGA